MGKVTDFLLRWLYIASIIEDRSEILHMPHHAPIPEHDHPLHLQYQNQHPPTQTAPPRHDPSIRTAASTRAKDTWRIEQHEWQSDVIRGILLYPPGTPRILALESLRMEIVREFDTDIQSANEMLSGYYGSKRRRRRNSTDRIRPAVRNDDYNDDTWESADGGVLDADLEIIEALRKVAGLSFSEDLRVLESSSSSATTTSSTSASTAIPRQAKEAQDLLKEMKEYLPQLVSVALHSRNALTPTLDPIAALKRVLVVRCLEDPTLGIDVCWLLEAEVGRAWKTLFEHRQQTGRRLIVVLPAEKARVIAKIGTEKRSAFDLLQDIEQATAYGYSNHQDTPHEHQQQQSYIANNYPNHPYPRLPASLSLKRCSHFGDTMHFIDLLTQTSMDLRITPMVHRNAVLKQRLEELNRRIRRRMVTKGQVSLDVLDRLSENDWPQMEDVTLDQLRFSVHFPLEPKSDFWAGGEDFPHHQRHQPITPHNKNNAVRVLNIISSECRLLSSRERCPLLIQLEVAETELIGSDARLYGGGAEFGATTEEVMGLLGGDRVARKGHASYRIPPELLGSSSTTTPSDGGIVGSSSTGDGEERNDKDIVVLPPATEDVARGGWQQDDTNLQEPYMYNTPYELLPQQQIANMHPPSIPHEPIPATPTHSTHTALLDRVFGLPWSQKCNQIRQTSPYGHIKGWRLASFIMKAGEDIRREALVMQLICKLKDKMEQDLPPSLRPYLQPYNIMCVGDEAGLLECLNDAKSLDEVKKNTDGFTTLRDYFERAYGSPQQQSMSQPAATTPVVTFQQAQDNFLRSLVGYSLICYILQVKDRHNANILIDRQGHLIHIDFGFVLGDTPKMGKVPLFSERAPFKLTTEFWDVIGGWDVEAGGLGARFCKMLEMAFECASSHSEELAGLVEASVLNLVKNSGEARKIANSVKGRLRMRGAKGSVEQKMFIMDLVNAALTSWGTSTYDWLQKSMNGYQ